MSTSFCNGHVTAPEALARSGSAGAPCSLLGARFGYGADEERLDTNARVVHLQINTSSQRSSRQTFRSCLQVTGQPQHNFCGARRPCVLYVPVHIFVL